MWLFSLFVALADIPRISSVHKSLNRVDLISISPGLVTILEFPKPIIEVRVGNSEILSTSISTVSSKELTLSLNRLNVATNLVVKSGNRFFVFDVVSNTSHHQDYVKVSSGYGSPEFSSNAEILNQGKFEIKNETQQSKTLTNPKQKVYFK